MDDEEREAMLRLIGVSPALSRAYDVLEAEGLATQGRLRLCLAGERQGHDPEAFARHLVKLIRGAQEVYRR